MSVPRPRSPRRVKLRRYFAPVCWDCNRSFGTFVETWFQTDRFWHGSRCVTWFVIVVSSIDGTSFLVVCLKKKETEQDVRCWTSITSALFFLLKNIHQHSPSDSLPKKKSDNDAEDLLCPISCTQQSKRMALIPSFYDFLTPKQTCARHFDGCCL